jgi:hypothetical protein
MDQLLGGMEDALNELRNNGLNDDQLLDYVKGVVRRYNHNNPNPHPITVEILNPYLERWGLARLYDNEALIN